MPKLRDRMDVVNTKINTSGGLVDFAKIRLASKEIKVMSPMAISIRPNRKTPNLYFMFSKNRLVALTGFEPVYSA